MPLTVLHLAYDDHSLLFIRHVAESFGLVPEESTLPDKAESVDVSSLPMCLVLIVDKSSVGTDERTTDFDLNRCYNKMSFKQKVTYLI